MEDLLDGLEGGERAARLKLLQRLLDDGSTPEEMRRRHSIRAGTEAAAVREAFAVRNHRSLGLPLPDLDEPVYDDDQVENLKVLRAMIERRRCPEDDLHLLGRDPRPVRRAAWPRRSSRSLTRALAPPGRHEADVALRLADFAEAMLPVLDRLTGAVLRLHLLDVVQNEAVAPAGGRGRWRARAR